MIEDFLLHALARCHAFDRIGVSAEITDVWDHILRLSDLRFDNADYLDGQLLEGILKVQMSDVGGLFLEAKEDVVFVRVILKGDKEATLS